jgi:hypothetical protein
MAEPTPKAAPAAKLVELVAVHVVEYAVAGTPKSVQPGVKFFIAPDEATWLVENGAAVLPVPA